MILVEKEYECSPRWAQSSSEGELRGKSSLDRSSLLPGNEEFCQWIQTLLPVLLLGKKLNFTVNHYKIWNRDKELISHNLLLMAKERPWNISWCWRTEPVAAPNLCLLCQLLAKASGFTQFLLPSHGGNLSAFKEVIYIYRAQIIHTVPID